MVNYIFHINASVSPIAGGIVSTMIKFEPGLHPPVPMIGDDLLFRKNGRRYSMTIANRAFNYGLDLDAGHSVKVVLAGPAVEL
jgi:hypothetical protein